MTIKFPCPRCSQPIEAADQAAGQMTSCPQCGNMATIPGVVTGAMPAGMPMLQGAPKSRGGSWSLPVVLGIAGVGLLVCCGLLGLLIAPAYFGARDAQLRMMAGNNVKQIVLALQNYADMHRGQLPPAVVTDENGKPLYSGRVLLLPFMEQQALYQRFDRTKAWDSPENLPLAQTTVLAFQSPKNRRRAGGCDFVFVSGPGTAFPGTNSVSFGDIHDGSSNTAVVVETKTGPASWAAPGDWDATTGPIPPGFHKNRTLVGFGDGHVQTLVTTPPFQFSREITTIAGGEVLSDL